VNTAHSEFTAHFGCFLHCNVPISYGEHLMIGLEIDEEHAGWLMFREAEQKRMLGRVEHQLHEAKDLCIELAEEIEQLLLPGACDDTDSVASTLDQVDLTVMRFLAAMHRQLRTELKETRAKLIRLGISTQAC
jgi:hypothetical protein